MTSSNFSEPQADSQGVTDPRVAHTAPPRAPRPRVPRPPQPPTERIGGAGYDPAFLARPVAAPTVAPALVDDLVRVDGSDVLRYTHFSLALSGSRRLARWVAWNVDGATVQDLPRTGLRFRYDPRVPAAAQIGDEVYADNRIDRGHIARRRDLCWGSKAEAQRANIDSFYFTNISPQVDDFNQSRRSGIWGQLEDALFEAVEVEDLRIDVQAGPVLAADDPTYRSVQLPREFYKVIAYVSAGRLEARAFLLTQRLDHLEGLDLSRFRTYQVGLPLLSARTGVVFDPVLADPAQGVLPEGEAAIPIDSLDDIRW